MEYPRHQIFTSHTGNYTAKKPSHPPPPLHLLFRSSVTMGTECRHTMSGSTGTQLLGGGGFIDPCRIFYQNYAHACNQFMLLAIIALFSTLFVILSSTVLLCYRRDYTGSLLTCWLICLHRQPVARPEVLQWGTTAGVWSEGAGGFTLPEAEGFLAVKRSEELANLPLC